jgi:large subunit ribosomal protein L21
MYAIIETGGKQYQVEPGDKIRVEKIVGEQGKNILFDKVLLVSDGNELKVGRPFIEGIKVRGKILYQGRDKKVIVFRFKRRKRYHKKRGHRQYCTAIKIEEIKS